MIFLVQFGINKHLLIFFKDHNHVITRNVFRFDEVLTLETSALKLFTVANLRYQLGC